MPRHLDLDALLGHKEPATFVLNEQTFTCVLEVSAISLMEMTVKMNGMAAEADEDGNPSGGENMGTEQMEAMINFLQSAVIPEQREAFVETIYNGNPPVSMGRLSALLEWVAQEVGGAPLDESEVSAPSATISQPNSTVASSQPTRPPAAFAPSPG